jgi:hypothetical protein
MMTSRAENYRRESKRAEKKAAVASGPYRDLLLSIAEAYALLARLEDELFEPLVLMKSTQCV